MEDIGRQSYIYEPDTFSEHNRLSSGVNSDEPAILTGADTISPEPSNNAQTSSVVPFLHTPFGYENAHDYFSNRCDLVESAIQECVSTLIFPTEDGPVVKSWLLTEISLWDNEKERIVILTKKAIMIIKYDFIAMRKREFKRIPLSEIDTVVIGKLVYPKSSLVPRLNGITSGISTVVRECILDRFPTSNKSSTGIHQTQETDLKSNLKLGPINMKHFESRERNMDGIRLMWNRGQQLNFLKKWNPFDSDIPFNTFTFHPLYYHKDGGDEQSRELYNVDQFSKLVIETVEELENNETPCVIHHSPIVLQCYVGLTSLVHNKTSLGFFKVRGKFSF